MREGKEKENIFKANLGGEAEKGGKKSLEEIEKYKKMIMWFGVGFFMLLIFFVWIANIKTVFESGKKESISKESTDWSGIMVDLKQDLGEFKKDIKEIKEVLENPETEIGLNEENRALPKNILGAEEEEIKDKIKKIEDKLKEEIEEEG